MKSTVKIVNLAILITLQLAIICSNVNSQTITTIAGTGTAGFLGDGGPATNAQFDTPSGVTVDKFGNIYIADDLNQVIHKVDPSGLMTRIAGDGSFGFIPDGSAATSGGLQLPRGTVGIAVDSSENLYFTDGSMVRKINTAGIITTIAGTGVYGVSGDNGPATAATLKYPVAVCIDKLGRIYIGDGQAANIRMVDNFGIISSFAGTGTYGFYGDGGMATNAQLKTPYDITIDDSLNFYFSDGASSRIRKVNSFGIITTIAGGASSGPTYCYGCPATSVNLIGPFGVAVDNYGNVFFADDVSQLIYKVSASGMLSPYAGSISGTSGFAGDGGPATSALFNAPTSICIDQQGSLFIADKLNYRFRKIWSLATSLPGISETALQLSIYPNPTLGAFTCNFTTAITEPASVTICNTFGQSVYTSTFTTNHPTQITLTAPPGIYYITATTPTGKVAKTKIVLQ